MADFTDVQQRGIGLRKWLNENAPECFSEQKHIIEGTQERVYWHYGYMVAIRDIERLLTSTSDLPLQPCTSETTSGVGGVEESETADEKVSAETGGEKAAHLPNLSDHCGECGHVRAKHGYGALGYNAASNCTLDDCDCPWWLEPNFPRTTKNQTASSGVEGAHEGTTADKSGSREPEKLWCPECCTESGKTEYGDCANKFHKSLAESSLSSPPPIDPQFLGEITEAAIKDAQYFREKSEGLVDYNEADPEDCAACAIVEDNPCPFHLGFAAGTKWAFATVRQSSSLSKSGAESAHSGKQNTADKSELLPTQLPKGDL